MRGTAQTGSRYSFYLDATAFDGAWPFPPTGRQGARHLHVGSIAAVDPRHGESVVAALHRAHGRATTSFDPNIRPLVTPDRDSVVALVERQVALASIVKASEEDLEWLYPGRADRGHARRLGALGPALLRRDARRARRRRLSRRRAAERRARRRSMSSTPSAPATASCRRCSRRWIATARLGAGGPRAEPRATRGLARLRRDRLGDHLHAQGLRSADRAPRSRR